MFEVLFRKNELFFESIFSENIGRNNFQFSSNLWKINMNMNFSQVFFCIFLFFRNTYLKEYFWVAASIYFNREASQKCENTTLQTNLRRVIISWRECLFNSSK